MKLGEKIFFAIKKELRQNKITQQQLSEKIGKSKHYLNVNLTRLKNNISSLKTVESLIDALDKDIIITLEDKK